MSHVIRHDNLNRRESLKFGDMPMDYGQFLKDMTDATPGLRDWDGTLKITVKPFTASTGGINSFVTGSYIEPGGNDVFAISAGLDGADNVIVKTIMSGTTGYSGFGERLANAPANVKQGSIISVPTEDNIVTVVDFHSENNNAALMVVHGYHKDTHYRHYRQTMATTQATNVALNRVNVGPAIALQDGTALIFPDYVNIAAVPGPLYIAIMNKLVSSNTYTPSYQSRANNIPAGAYAFKYMFRNSTNTAIYAPVWGQDKKFIKVGVGVGSVGAPALQAVDYPYSFFSFIGSIDFANGLRQLVVGTPKNHISRVFNTLDDTGASGWGSTSANENCCFSAAKTIGDGIGVILPAGNELGHGWPVGVNASPNKNIVNIHQRMDNLPVTGSTGSKDVGCVYVGNKIFQLFDNKLITYELVGVGAPPLEYQMHPYINHS
jgi:hypothetical protein